jgi:hypothetical protein
MIANETIGEALRRAESMLVSKRDEARRGDTMPLPRDAGPEVHALAQAQVTAEAEADDDMTPTPSALMSLIPVGEVSVTPVR